MTKLSREFKQALVSFGAAIGEKDFTRSKVPHNLLGQPALWFVVVEIGSMDQALRLFDQRLGGFGVGMTKRVDGNPAAEIEVALAGGIPEIAALAACEGQIKARVARHNETTKQLFD